MKFTKGMGLAAAVAVSGLGAIAVRGIAQNGGESELGGRFTQEQTFTTAYWLEEDDDTSTTVGGSNDGHTCAGQRSDRHQTDTATGHCGHNGSVFNANLFGTIIAAMDHTNTNPLRIPNSAWFVGAAPNNGDRVLSSSAAIYTADGDGGKCLETVNGVTRSFTKWSGALSVDK